MKRLSEQTLYEILEVPPDASRGTIAAAVQRARSLYGPGSLATYTLMSSDEAALLSRRIEDAASTLLDDRARSRYDAELSRAAPPPRKAEAARIPPVIPAVRMMPPPQRELDPGAAGEEQDEARPLPPTAPRTAGSPILLSREVSAPAPAPAAAPALTPAPIPPTALTPAPVAPPALTPIPRAAAPVAAGAPPVPDSTSWTGEVLRRLREARGITLEQLSVRIKVTRHHIENIEADRFTALPAPVYLRGILLSMARELRLDGQKVARSYLERASAGAAGGGQKPR